jgi:hypothetical protein
MRRTLIVALLLACLFGLYSTFHFLTVQDISSPQQLPRVRYNQYWWFGFSIVCAAGLVLTLRRRRG